MLFFFIFLIFFFPSFPLSRGRLLELSRGLHRAVAELLRLTDHALLHDAAPDRISDVIQDVHQALDVRDISLSLLLLLNP